MKHVKVENDPSYGRDISTGAIVNLNNDAYEAHIRNKKQKQNAQQRIDSLENEVKELKNLLGQLLGKIGQ